MTIFWWLIYPPSWHDSKTDLSALTPHVAPQIVCVVFVGVNTQQVIRTAMEKVTTRALDDT